MKAGAPENQRIGPTLRSVTSHWIRVLPAPTGRSQPGAPVLEIRSPHPPTVMGVRPTQPRSHRRSTVPTASTDAANRSDNCRSTRGR